MTSGLSGASLRTRAKLYNLLHQDAAYKGGSQEEQAARRADERGMANELLVQADPSISELIHT